MAVTIHFIIRSHEWTLYHTLIGFEQIDSPHTGQNIAAKFCKIIQWYGLLQNVFACTMDNAGNNDTFVASMKTRIPIMLNGDFFQNRCNAHCYNLIAQDGLSLLKEQLADLRTFIKCIRTPKSNDQFEQRIAEDRNAVRLEKMARPSLDVRTRWNSTHDMIKSVLPYAEVIDSMSQSEVDDYNVDPETNELRATRVQLPLFEHGFWSNLEKLKLFLQPLKVGTETLSARKAPTAHLVIEEIHILQDTIDNVQPLETNVLGNAADKMASKFVKYYSDLPKSFIIAHILDPRAKIEMVELFQREEGSNLKALFRDTIRTTFDKYFKGEPEPASLPAAEISSSASTTTAGCDVTNSSDPRGFYAARKAALSKANSVQRTLAAAPDTVAAPDDLEVYLSHDLEPYVETKEPFDILLWWRKNEFKYPKLAVMAALFLGN